MDLNKFYDKLYNWILYVGPKLIISVLFLFVGWWIINTVIKILGKSLEKRRVDSSIRPFVLSLLSTIFKILLLLTSIQIVGIKLTIFTTIIGALGVAAGLALSGTLQNFTAGIIILMLKPFRIGDIVIAQGQEGTVSFIRIFYTVMTTYDNRTVIIPNSKLSNEVIVNLSRMGRRRLDIEMKFNFTIDYNDVKNRIEQTLAAHSELLATPPHRIGISSIEPDGYKVMVNVWVKAHGYQDAKLKLLEMMVADLKSSGIKLPGL